MSPPSNKGMLKAFSSSTLRQLSDFLSADGGNEHMAKIRYEHHEKKRRVKMRQIQEFMHAMTKKSKSNLITLSLIPKENIAELKKSKSMYTLITLLI